MAGLAGCRNRTIAGVVDVWSEPGRVQRLSFRGRLAGHPAKLSAECPLAVFRQCRRQSLQWTAGGRRGHDGACFVVEVVRDCDRGEVRDPDDLVACPVRVVRRGAAGRGEPRGLPVRRRSGRTGWCWPVRRRGLMDPVQGRCLSAWSPGRPSGHPDHGDHGRRDGHLDHVCHACRVGRCDHVGRSVPFEWAEFRSG